MGKNRRRKLKLKRAKNKKKESPAASPAPWLELPREVTANILHRLGAHEILESAQKVCTLWRNVCKDPSMWRVIDMKNLAYYACPSSRYLDIMCRHAVDRSQGQLTEIHIDYFATDELLEYISERSSKLRCFRLGGCYGVSDYGLHEAAKKFPLLEELHFVFVKNCNQGIEAIGHSCLKLKSFTLSGSDYKHRHLINDEDDDDDYDDDYDALAIAKSMPGLCHLRLLGNNMTNKGLQAILDGCPLLESLDIRRCFNVDLRGDLGKRITEKIKDFKRPYDSMEGCEWDADIFDSEEYDEGYYSSGYSYVDSLLDYDDYFNDFHFGSDYNSDGGFDIFDGYGGFDIFDGAWNYY